MKKNFLLGILLLAMPCSDAHMKRSIAWVKKNSTTVITSIAALMVGAAVTYKLQRSRHRDNHDTDGEALSTYKPEEKDTHELRTFSTPTQRPQTPQAPQENSPYINYLPNINTLYSSNPSSSESSLSCDSNESPRFQVSPVINLIEYCNRPNSAPASLT
ncbi:MAG: hypothetical protein WD068_03325 [Candidatus Babeliales bacterium]